MIRRSMSWLCVIVSLGSAISCSTTYTNIPPQAGDIAGHNVNSNPVCHVSIEAIRATLSEQPIDRAYTIILPNDTNALTYAKVLSALGDLASRDADPSLPIIEIRQIRIRGNKAEVDLLRPANVNDLAGPRQLVTVYLHWDLMANWYPRNLHTWLAPHERLLPDTTQIAMPPVAP